jgi:hypothetical protein
MNLSHSQSVDKIVNTSPPHSIDWLPSVATDFEAVAHGEACLPILSPHSLHPNFLPHESGAHHRRNMKFVKKRAGWKGLNMLALYKNIQSVKTPSFAGEPKSSIISGRRETMRK